MKKNLLVALLLAGCSHVVLAAPQTFDEALQLLTEKSQRNDFAAALKDVDKTLALAQTNEQKAKVYSRIGDVKFKQLDFAAAREQYEQILKLSDLAPATKSNALLLIGTTYLLQQPNDYVKTRETFARIVDGEEFSERDRIGARLQIASTYQSAGDITSARAQWQNVARDETAELWARVSALVSLAEMERFQKNYAAVLVNYEQAIALDSGDITIKAVALDGIAQSYLEQKNFAQARQKFAEILKLDIKEAPEPNRPALQTLQAGAQMNIAKSYASEGDKKRARAEYAKILAMSGSQPYAVQVKYELEQLDKKTEIDP